MGGSEIHAAILRRLARAFIEGRRDAHEMLERLRAEHPELDEPLA